MHITAFQLAQIAAPLVQTDLDNHLLTFEQKCERAIYRAEALLEACENYLREIDTSSTVKAYEKEQQKP